MLPVDLVGHDVVEVVASHETIVIEVSAGEHVVELLVSQVFTKILGDLLEFKGADLALNQ